MPKYNKTTAVAAVLALAVGASPALAADLSLPPAEPEPYIAPVSVFSWTGFYAGGIIGYGFGDFSSNADNRLGVAIANPAAAFSSNPDEADGLIGGAQIGYLHQYNRFVVGAEAEFLFSGIEDDFTITGGAGPVRGDAELNYLGTVTAKVGVTPIDRVLLYVEGGYAFGEIDVSANLQPAIAGAGSQSDSSLHHGWTVGAGAEYAILDNVSVLAEYSYVDLGEETVDLGPVTNVDTEFEGHLLKTGVNFRF